MSLAEPSDKAAAFNRRHKTVPPGYQSVGTAITVAKDASKVCLEAGSATVEVTALAPDLFRVGFFPDDRPVNYSSVAVLAQDWQPGPVTIAEEAGVLTLTTSAATAHLSLGQFRIGFTDQFGREFALDDPELGMGWFPASGEAAVRVYKQHLAGAHYFRCGERTGELDKTGSRQLFWDVGPPRGQTALENNLYSSIPFTLVLSESQAWGLFVHSTTRVR